MENSPVGQDFLALPESHHHVSRLVVLTIILGVFAGAVWAYNYFTYSPASPAEEATYSDPALDPNYNPPLTLTPEEAEIREGLLNDTSNPPMKLTEEEKKIRDRILQEDNN